MNHFFAHNINYYIIKSALHNQKPIEALIWEIIKSGIKIWLETAYQDNSGTMAQDGRMRSFMSPTNDQEAPMAPYLL